MRLACRFRRRAEKSFFRDRVSRGAPEEIDGHDKVYIPQVYIAHGVADNVLPIASTSRTLVS